MSELGRKFSASGNVEVIASKSTEAARAGSGVPLTEVLKLQQIAQGKTVLATEMTPFIEQMLKYAVTPISKAHSTVAGKFKNPDAHTLSNNILKSQDKFVSR